MSYVWWIGGLVVIVHKEYNRMGVASRRRVRVTLVCGHTEQITESDMRGDISGDLW